MYAGAVVGQVVVGKMPKKLRHKPIGLDGARSTIIGRKSNREFDFGWWTESNADSW